MPVKIPLRKTLRSESAGATALLVADSGAKLLRNFVGMAEYLLQGGSLANDVRSNIDNSLQHLANYDEDSLFRMLSSPIFRGWYSGFGRLNSLLEPSRDLGRLLELWNNNTHSLVFGPDFECKMKVENGCAVTWDSIAALHCRGYEYIFVIKSGSKVEIYSPDQSFLLLSFRVDDSFQGVEICQDSGTLELLLPKRYLPNTNIPIRNDLPPLQLRLNTWERESAIDGTLDISPATYDPALDVSEFELAATLINDVWPEEYEDFSETLHVVVPRNAPPRWRARGMTVSSYQGAIWLMARGLLPLFENLIHEQSHVKLRYIEEHTPLLAANQRAERYKVGWRSDARPMQGIYEGVYVHLHMLLGLDRLLAARQSLIPEDAIRDRRTQLLKEIAEGTAILQAHAVLTDSGRAFLDWSRETHSSVASRAREAA